MEFLSHPQQLSSSDTHDIPCRTSVAQSAEGDGQMTASALFGPAWEGDSLEVLWQHAGRAFCRLCDGAGRERHAFIPVLSGTEHPTSETIDRLWHEYELRDFVDG